MRAKPYSSGATALVFVCSITGAVASIYIVDWNGGRWIDPELEVPTLPYIGRRGRVTMRTIELTDWFPSLLHNMCNRMILAIV